MKEKFFEYVCEHFNVADRYIVLNIIVWVFDQSMDKEDTISALMSLLDGLGITREEIEQFINW